MIVLKSFIKEDGSRKAEIFERTDGTFGFQELAFGKEEDMWYPVGKYSISIVDSMEHAVSEARGRIKWLSDESRNEAD